MEETIMPHWLIEPLTKAPSRLAKKAADKIDPPQGEGGRLRGFLAGALEGVGDLASEATSPIGMATSLIPAARPLGRLARQSPLYGIDDTIRSSRRMMDESRALSRGMKSEGDVDLAELYERLGPEFVPIGGEDIMNTVRRARMANEALKLKQVSGEGTRFTGKRMPIGGNDVDVVEMMQKIDRARGRR